MKYSPVILVLLLTPVLPFVAADGPATKPMVGNIPAAKVLFLGNSITLHGPAPSIGWTGNWGMAATSEEKDYVHLLTADIAKAAGAKPEIKVRNIADFERGHDEFEIETTLKEFLEFDADIVILAIGENVPELKEEDQQAKYAAAFTRLLASLKKRGGPAIFVRGCFWPSPIKDEIMRKAALQAGATFVDIAKLGQVEANAARSERKIEHAGVAAHPGDQGMRAIADAIYASILERAKPAARE